MTHLGGRSGPAVPPDGHPGQGRQRVPAAPGVQRSPGHPVRALPPRGVARGDFGESLRYKRSALTLVLERLPETAKLAASALLLTLCIAIPVGRFSAVRRGSVFEVSRSKSDRPDLSDPMTRDGGHELSNLGRRHQRLPRPTSREAKTCHYGRVVSDTNGRAWAGRPTAIRPLAGRGDGAHRTVGWTPRARARADAPRVAGDCCGRAIGVAARCCSSRCNPVMRVHVRVDYRASCRRGDATAGQCPV
jgi:hypothetical protein